MILHPSKDQARLLLTVTLLVVVSTVAIIIAVTIRAASTDSTIDKLNANHAGQICTISILRQITNAGGATDAERRTRYERIFDEQWLIDNCSLSRDEAHGIAEGR